MGEGVDPDEAWRAGADEDREGTRTDGAGVDDARSTSPWSRDDWMPAPSAPPRFSDRWGGQEPRTSRPDASGAEPHAGRLGHDPGPNAVVDEPRDQPDDRPDDRQADGASEQDRARRTLLVGAGLTAVAVVAVFALVRSGDGDPGTADEDAATTATAAATDEPSTSVPRTTIARPTTTTPTPTLVARSIDPSVEERPETSFSLVLPKVAEVELGAVPDWTEWTLPIVAPLDDIGVPTEVVFATRGIVHRVQLPDGAVRSLALTDVWEDGALLAVAGDTVAVSRRDEVVLVRDELPAVAVEVGMVNAIRPRPAQGDFVVSVTDEFGGTQRNLILSADGVTVPIERPWFDDQWPESMAVSPTGELLTTAPGGVYAAQPLGDEAPRRVLDGMIVALGPNHLLVNRCDVALTCGYVVAELATGAITEAAPIVDESAYWGSGGISPDGTRLAVLDYGRSGLPHWVIYDLATGDVVAELELATSASPSFDPWAPDGSGLFFIDGDSLSFRSLDGRGFDLRGLGSWTNLAVRPSSAAMASVVG